LWIAVRKEEIVERFAADEDHGETIRISRVHCKEAAAQVDPRNPQEVQGFAERVLKAPASSSRLDERTIQPRHLIVRTRSGGRRKPPGRRERVSIRRRGEVGSGVRDPLDDATQRTPRIASWGRSPTSPL